MVVDLVDESWKDVVDVDCSLDSDVGMVLVVVVDIGCWLLGV